MKLVQFLLYIVTAYFLIGDQHWIVGSIYILFLTSMLYQAVKEEYE